MSQEFIKKVDCNDIKYACISRDLNDKKLKKSRAKHINMKRRQTRLRRAASKARETDDPTILVDAQVAELTRLVS